MAARIEDHFMTAEYDGRIIATARYSKDAAADGRGAWIVSGLPHRLFDRNQAITAMVLAERLAAGHGDNDLFVIGWREELGMGAKGRQGAKVRICLGAPNSPYVANRGVEEGIGDAMPAKVRNALALYGPLSENANAEIKLHSTVLYNSIYLADDQILVNQHVYGSSAAHSPVFHLSESGPAAMAKGYLESFCHIWELTAAITDANGG